MVKNSLTLLCLFVFFFLFHTVALSTSKEVEIWYSARPHGEILVDISINDPHIRGLIVKATIPRGRRLLSATPDVRQFKDGVLKWFIETGGRKKIGLRARLDRAVSDDDLHVEAMFKLPGTQGLLTVEAKKR